MSDPAVLPIIAIDVDAYDGQTTRTIRYCASSVPLVGTVGTVRAQYLPGLVTPLKLGSSISAEQYGSPVRGAPAGGGISYDLREEEWAELAWHYQGREFRAYLGDTATGYPSLGLVYKGRVADLTFPVAGVIRAQLSITDASADLDNPIVDAVYPDTALEPIRGLPLPELIGGPCLSHEPVLIDDPSGVYQITRPIADFPLVAVDNLRVGGVPWQQTTGTPFPGQYSVDLAAGTVTLGSTTLGMDVRVDAHTAPITTAGLLRFLVERAGGTVDDASMTALDLAAPYEIGWCTSTSPVNLLSALDEIVAGIGGYWLFGPAGTFVAGVQETPTVLASTRTLTDREIAAMAESGMLPPAWRIRIEYSRIWAPQSTFGTAVTDAEKQRWSEGGTTAAAYENEDIKTAEPRAVDVPLIRSLVTNEADALDIRDRLSSAWNVPRRVYDLNVWFDNASPAPSLYETVDVDFQLVRGAFRVHSVIRSLGGEPSQIRLWGESGIVGALVSLTSGDNSNLGSDNEDHTVDEGEPDDPPVDPGDEAFELTADDDATVLTADDGTTPLTAGPSL